MNHPPAGFIPPGPIDHVAIAVHDLDEACDRYERLTGARVSARETVGAVDLAFVHVPGDTSIELISPTIPDTALARFLERHGEALHHICFLVADIDSALSQVADHGLRLIDAEARPGAAGSRIGFLHPAAFGGVLVELKQKPQR